MFSSTTKEDMATSYSRSAHLAAGVSMVIEDGPPGPRLDRRAPVAEMPFPLRTAATVTQISKPIAGASSTRNRRDSIYRSARWLRDRETRSWRLSARCTRVPYGCRHRALGQRVWRIFSRFAAPMITRTRLGYFVPRLPGYGMRAPGKDSLATFEAVPWSAEFFEAGIA